MILILFIIFRVCFFNPYNSSLRGTIARIGVPSFTHFITQYIKSLSLNDPIYFTIKSICFLNIVEWYKFLVIRSLKLGLYAFSFKEFVNRCLLFIFLFLSHFYGFLLFFLSSLKPYIKKCGFFYTLIFFNVNSVCVKSVFCLFIIQFFLCISVSKAIVWIQLL